MKGVYVKQIHSKTLYQKEPLSIADEVIVSNVSLLLITFPESYVSRI